MSTSKGERARYLVLAIVSALALSACGTSFGDTCDAEAQCEGGNDSDIDACIAAGEGAADVAAAYDCSDAFDKLLDCIDRTGNCDSGNYKTNCNDESSALSKCQDAASAR